MQAPPASVIWHWSRKMDCRNCVEMRFALSMRARYTAPRWAMGFCEALNSLMGKPGSWYFGRCSKVGSEFAAQCIKFCVDNGCRNTTLAADARGTAARSATSMPRSL